MQGRIVLEKVLEIYALLATAYSLAIRQAQQREARRYACTFLTVLTVLTTHFFQVENFFVASLRVSQRAFCRKRYLCYLALFSAI